MTLLKEINNLTWFDEINKLKSILKKIISNTAISPNNNTVVIMTTSKLTLIDLNAEYPDAQLGFQVQNITVDTGVHIFLNQQ